MARALSSLRCLGQFAKQALNQAELEGSSSIFSGNLQKRFLYNERYSPRQFSKEKPLDTSAMWWRKNAFIEAWYYRRDHLEKEFSWTSRNTFELTYFIGGITGLFYALSLFGLRSSDRQNGYPKRNVLWHSAETSFINPDEREFY